MLRAIQEFFERNMQSPHPGETEQSTEHTLQLATAALLIEMTHADFNKTTDERQAVTDNLLRFFELTPDEIKKLVNLAEQEVVESTSLHQFTSLINQHFTSEQKCEVIEMLWQVSYADGHKDMHEEHLVRKVAGLLYVPHRDFIRARHRAEEKLARQGEKGS